MAVGGGHVHVDHLMAANFLMMLCVVKSRGQRIEAAGEGHVEGGGEEGDEDVRLDVFDALMEDLVDGEVALDGLEWFLYGDELEIIGAQIRAL